MANSLLEYQTQINNLCYGNSMWCTRSEAYKFLRQIDPPEILEEWHQKEMQDADGKLDMESAIEVCQEALKWLIRASKKAKSLEPWAQGHKLPDSVENPRSLINEALIAAKAAFEAFAVVDTDPVLMMRRQAPRLLVLEYLVAVVRISIQLCNLACPAHAEWQEYVEEAITSAKLVDFNFDTPDMYRSQYFKPTWYGISIL